MRVCEVCGHKGEVRRLVYCIKCKDSAVHYYCLVKYSPCHPNFNWKCEDCEPKTLAKVIPSRKSERITEKRDQAVDVRINMKKRLCKRPLRSDHDDVKELMVEKVDLENDHFLPRMRTLTADHVKVFENVDEKAGLRNHHLVLKEKSLTEDSGALKEKLELAKQYALSNNHFLCKKWSSTEDPVNPNNKMDEIAIIENGHLSDKWSLTEATTDVKEKTAERATSSNDMRNHVNVKETVAKKAALTNVSFFPKKSSSAYHIDVNGKKFEKVALEVNRFVPNKKSSTSDPVERKLAQKDALKNQRFLPTNWLESSSMGNHVNVKETVAEKAALTNVSFFPKKSSSANHADVNGKKFEKIDLEIDRVIRNKKSSTADPVERNVIQKDALKNQRLLDMNWPLIADPVYDTEGQMVEKSALPSDHFIHTERFSSGDHVYLKEQKAKKSVLLDHVLPPKKRVSTTKIIEVKEKTASEPGIRNGHTLPTKLSSTADEVNIKEILDKKSVLINDDSLRCKSSSSSDVCAMDEKMRETVALTNSCSPPLYHLSCSYAAKPAADPIWRGAFRISNFKNQSFQLTAHLSSKACQRVYEAARTIPVLVDVKFLPKCVAWPVSFQKSPPTDDSIALFLFPEFARDEKVYDALLEEINQHNAALKTTINDVDLLIFSSLELPEEHWRYQRKYYLWGVFRKTKM